MSHVRRWPTERKYTLSTIGAHRIFRLNGHEARLVMPCSAYVAPFSCRMKLTLALASWARLQGVQQQQKRDASVILGETAAALLARLFVVILVVVVVGGVVAQELTLQQIRGAAIPTYVRARAIRHRGSDWAPGRGTTVRGLWRDAASADCATLFGGGVARRNTERCFSRFRVLHSSVLALNTRHLTHSHAKSSTVSSGRGRGANATFPSLHVILVLGFLRPRRRRRRRALVFDRLGVSRSDPAGARRVHGTP